MTVHTLSRYEGRFYRPFHVLSDPLNTDTVDEIIELGSATPMETGTLAPADGPIYLDTSFRGARVSWIHPGKDVVPLLARLAEAVERANDEAYGFDLLGFAEPIQYTEYKAPSVGYDWHVDLTPAPTELQRKLSITLQLSEAEDYEGGDLEFRDGTAAVTAPRGRGLLVAFPSFQQHRVTPVTRGLRRSLVIWIGGPSFR